MLGHDWLERSLRQGAVTDLATAGAAGPSGLAHAERRETVMQEKALRGFSATVSIDVLRFFNGRERHERERLRFAALENRGTVCAGEHADFAIDLTQILIAAAIHALLLVEHADAESLLLHVIEGLGNRELVGLGEFLQHRRFHFFFQGIHRFAAVDLLLVIERAFDAVAGDLIGHFENLLIHRHQRHLALRLADLRGELLLDPNHLAGMSVGELERLDEFLFGHFLRGAFDHDDVVFRADVNEIEIARVTLVVRRVRDELAIDATHAHRANRAGERNVGHRQGGRGAVDREDVRIVLAIRAEQDRNDLRVIKIARREQAAGAAGPSCAK